MIEKINIESAKDFLELIFPFDALSDEIRSIYLQVVYLRSELTKESDRGCALLAASFVDEMLEKLLRKKLSGSKKHIDSLFNSNGSLSTFSSRISIAYSIGLLSDLHFSDLQIIRKVRNIFGHSPEVISFSNEKISSLCDSLKMVASPMSNEARSKYISSVYYIVGSFLVLIGSELKFKVRVDKDFEMVKEFSYKMFGIKK